MRQTRIAAVTLVPSLSLSLALSLAVSLALAPALPFGAARAFGLSYERPQRHAVTVAPGDGAAAPGLGEAPRSERCAASSASEGNANQQARSVKQYGQTSGGYRC